MNILFTCAGRRNYLLDYFKAIDDVRVIACDASKYAPALYIADEYFIVPDVYDLNYISILLSQAKERNINAIIPNLPCLGMLKYLTFVFNQIIS